MDFKDELDLCKANFDKEYSDLFQVFDFNKNIQEVIGTFFDRFAKLAEEDKRYELGRKARRISTYLETLYKYPEFQASYRIIFAQCITSAVSILEDYLENIFLLCIRKDPSKALLAQTEIKIPSQIIMEFGFDLNKYLGKSILNEKTNKINFQDLQSTSRTFKAYTLLEVESLLLKDQDMKDDLIYMQSIRHIILHNGKKIDQKFLDQIRATKYSGRHKINEEIDIIGLPVKELIENAKKFSNLVYKDFTKIC